MLLIETLEIICKLTSIVEHIYCYNLKMKLNSCEFLTNHSHYLKNQKIVEQEE